MDLKTVTGLMLFYKVSIEHILIIIQIFLALKL